MKALTFRGRQNIQFESVPDPEILDPLDAIVKVTLTAICGSDLHIYHEREHGCDHGTVMGHEFTGEIMAIGSGVKTHRIGDKVISPFTTNCGTCYFCKIGLTARCTSSQLYGWVEGGKGLHGGQSQYVRVPTADATLRSLPDGVSQEEAILLGDVFSTGFFCAQNAEIRPDGTYVVIGCGPVGLMAIVSAIELGATKVFAVDSIPARLNKAQQFGAIPVNYKETSVVDMIMESTKGIGADATMEAVGNHGAGQLAMELIRPGGIVSTAGVCNDKHMAFSPVQAYNKNLTFKVGRCSARYFMDGLIPVVQEKKYDISSIITHKISLSEGKRGYDVFDKKEDDCLKVVLVP
ncbi:MAG: alcohol dehydrogenase family protein [Bacteroidota bacterium]